MLVARRSKPLCGLCRTQLYSLFTSGVAVQSRSTPPSARHSRAGPSTRTHTFHTTRLYRNETNQKDQNVAPDVLAKPLQSPEEIQAFVRQIKQSFGNTLPKDLLTAEEYNVYERLYGAPLGETPEEDVALLQDSILENTEDVEPEPDSPTTTLLRETGGKLQDVINEEAEFDSDTGRAIAGELQEVDEMSPRGRRLRELEQKRNQAAEAELEQRVKDIEEQENYDEGEEVLEAEQDVERLKAERYLNALEEAADESSIVRTHPLTAAGKSGTTPSTIFIPRDTFTDPVVSILSSISNKHLAEFTQKTFGGSLLPNSVATPSTKGHLQQQPIALEATQPKMQTAEVNALLACNLPGTYAVVLSTLIETRKRLGSGWLEGLLNKPGGPSILDFGGAGAGVLAWRDIIRAEWERMHPGGSPEATSVPLGKATVVTGAYELRTQVSKLLNDTTFLPRLPDFSPAEHLPGTRGYDPKARKHYDVIVAPHTLWTLKEDYLRKAQIQNLWSLLNPDGGVLVVLEKGVPRGFELVAGARETLLKNHISSPNSEQFENEISDLTTERYTKKETGMIVAPCTNHSTCPMYTTSGEMTGRKDHCHFQQRFIRPAFLQRIHGISGRNYEDIRYSYISVQRGRDMRLTSDVPQNEEATLAALEGYENAEEDPSMLSLPRVIVPPLKRHKHVVFDLCTPSAQLERWTLPLSKSKLGYRDARKARWGDLWALGAKTRVVRQARNGVAKNDKALKKRVIEVGVGDFEEQDTLRELGPSKGKDRKKKDGRKGRTWQKSKAVKESDFL